MSDRFRPGTLQWIITVLVSLTVGMFIGSYVGSSQSGWASSPPVVLRELAPVTTENMSSVDKRGVRVKNSSVDHDVYNPYPYYPWWPEFNDMVMNSKVMEGLHEGDKRHGDKVGKEAILELLYDLDDFVAAHPAESDPYKVTERPTPLTFDCKSPKYAEFLTGSVRSKPAKVAWAFQFAGAFQLLDIALYELDGAVDYYIIYEATFVHRCVRKPLYFERHKLRCVWYQAIPHFQHSLQELEL